MRPPSLLDVSARLDVAGRSGRMARPGRQEERMGKNSGRAVRTLPQTGSKPTTTGWHGNPIAIDSARPVTSCRNPPHPNGKQATMLPALAAKHLFASALGLVAGGIARYDRSLV